MARSRADAREQAKQTREAAKPSKAFVPPPLILDQSGREVDAHGNVVAVKQSTVATSLVRKPSHMFCTYLGQP